MVDPRRPDLLDESESDDVARRQRLNERLRAAWVEGAEEESRRRLGRGLTADELERVLEHYPGDVEAN